MSLWSASSRAQSNTQHNQNVLERYDPKADTHVTEQLADAVAQYGPSTLLIWSSDHTPQNRGSPDLRTAIPHVGMHARL
jgi:hypothetical protein